MSTSGFASTVLDDTNKLSSSEPHAYCRIVKIGKNAKAHRADIFAIAQLSCYILRHYFSLNVCGGLLMSMRVTVLI